MAGEIGLARAHALVAGERVTELLALVDSGTLRALILTMAATLGRYKTSRL